MDDDGTWKRGIRFPFFTRGDIVLLLLFAIATCMRRIEDSLIFHRQIVISKMNNMRHYIPSPRS